MSASEKQEYESLCTRATSYIKKCSQKKTVQISNKKSVRNKFFLQCDEHNKKFKSSWHKDCVNCEKCLNISPSEQLPNGTLPTTKQVLAFILHHCSLNSSSAIHNDIVHDLMLQWVYCNIYTVSRKTVKKALEKLKSDFKCLYHYPNAKKTNSYYIKSQTFIANTNRLFDIKVNDDIRKRSQEKLWGVKMTSVEEKFYLNMCKVPQVGQCSSFVDRRWAIQNARKESRSEAQKAAFQQSKVGYINYKYVKKNTSIKRMKYLMRLFTCEITICQKAISPCEPSTGKTILLGNVFFSKCQL